LNTSTSVFSAGKENTLIIITSALISASISFVPAKNKKGKVIKKVR
jgi:hypothetical protein